MNAFWILLLALVLLTPAADAQGPPGCYTPRFTPAEEAAAEKRVVDAEKRDPKGAELASALEDLADVDRDMRPAKARSELRRALAIRQGLSGKKNAISPASTLVKIADTYEMQGDYGEAMKQLSRAEVLNKTDVHHTAKGTMWAIYYHEANCLTSGPSKDRVLAEEKGRAALALAEKLYGSDSAHVFQSLGLLYAVYMGANKHTDANAVRARMDTLIVKLGTPMVGAGTARHLDLDPILKREDAAH